MELTTLRQYVAIAKAGHMTRAAQSLGVTQPALSAMIKKLEAETGAELLHRTGRGVDLTEAGRLFLEHAQDAIRRADAGVQAVREMMGLERGSIRVGGGATAVTYLLPRVVRDVRSEHPGLRFYVREAGSSAVAAAVLNGELDLGIVTLPMRESESAELVVTPLVEDELRLIVPPDSPEPGKGGPRLARDAGGGRRVAKRARSVGSAGAGAAGANGAGERSSIYGALRRAGSFRWGDLEGVPIVAFEAETAVRALIDQSAAKAGVGLNVVMELRSIESIKRMVGAGIGVGFVSRFAIEEGSGLVCRDGRLSRRLAIVKRRGRSLSPAADAFERETLARLRHEQSR